MTAHRRAIAGALAVSIAFAGFAAPVASAATVFSVSGTETFHPPPFPDQLLPGLFLGDTVDRVSYPAAIFGMDASIAVAVSGLTDAVNSRVGPVVLAGFSQGAIAVAYEKKRIMSVPTGQRPAADQLSFVTIGDPTGPGGIMRFLPFSVPLINLTPIIPPDTPYASVIVNGEYDGWGDFPDRPWNLISLANALLGIAYVHGRYELAPGGLDLSVVPAENITVTTNSLGGMTTNYLIPTPKLPLLQPLRDIGVPEPIVTALEGPLKQIVDAGYARNDAKPAALQSVPSTPSSRAVASVPRPQRAAPTSAVKRPAPANTPRRASAAVRSATAA